ncbi:TAP-like protein-domain-containing protein [Hypoxylon sp. FL1857]|nr:TAP-like protein-domain-containing protein [Hypoxylon sp. FL1857]
MVSSKILAPIILWITAQGSTAATIRRDNYPGIQWGPCDIDTKGLPVQCAKLTVPLDYTDKSSNRTLDLDVIKYPAQKQPKRGSIILNFGGPGQDGLNSMIEYANIQGPITGGYHDLVSWDPRGTRNTLLFDCWPGNLSSYYDTLGGTLAGAADTAKGRLWAEGQIQANKCYDQLKDTGDLVGMAFAARDMMSIVDALGEDGMLRYWGISGGTAMGATVAAMFPDRVESVVLDGVMNSHQYYNSFGEPEMVASSDGSWEEFMRGCITNSNNCALARNRTYEELEVAMAQLWDTIRNNPPVYNGPLLPYAIVFDYTTFVDFVYNSLYRPTSFPELASVLDDVLHGNLETFAQALVTNGAPAQVNAQAILGIRCGDKKPRTDALADLEPVLDEYRRTSKWFWDWNWGAYVMPCAQWKFHAKERYEGDFNNIRTKNPVLFIGNSFDPVTPLVSARNMSAGFEGSALLTHNAHGHTSIAQASNCTNAAIQDYFLEGKLPAPGTVCEPNVPLFGTA